MSGKKIIKGLQEALEHESRPLTEAERLERAAHIAFEEGDTQHWYELLERAKSAKRRAREDAAGVKNPWNVVR